VVVGEVEWVAGVVEQGRGELVANKVRKEDMGMPAIGAVGAKVDKLEGEGVLVVVLAFVTAPTSCYCFPPYCPYCEDSPA
jgi:hypothetical protein